MAQQDKEWETIDDWEDVGDWEDVKPVEKNGKTIWQAINTPLIPQVAAPAKAASGWLERLRQNLPKSEQEDRFINENLGFLQGASEAAGDVAASFTSPLSAMAMLLSGGAAASSKAFPMLSRGMAALASAPALGHGAVQVTSPDSSLSDRAFGVAEMAGGAAGLKYATKPAVKPGLPPIRQAPKPITNPARLLEAPIDPILASETGLAQRRSIVEGNPIEEARLAGYEFDNEPVPPIKPPAPTNNLHGGTAAIEYGEPILPTAKKPSRVKRGTLRDEGVDAIDEQVNAYVGKNIEPAIPGASTGVRAVLAKARQTFSDFANGSLVSIERRLEKMGPAGNRIRQAISQTEYRKRELFNTYADPFVRAVTGLKPDEVANFIDVMDTGAEPINPRVAQAVKVTRSITDRMGLDAELSGVRGKSTTGQAVPWKSMKENYWPRLPKNPLGSKKFIKELMDNNPDMTIEEAMKLSRRYLNNSEIFNSPQHSRLPGKFPFDYRKDLGAMYEHIASMSDIISRAEILGAGDIGVKTSPIYKLIQAAPDPVEANSLVRSHLRGAIDKNDAFYRAVKAGNRAAVKSQVFTKLGLFVISNLNNQLQNVLRGTVSEAGKNFAKTMMGSPTLKALAKEYGTVSVGEIPANILAEAGKKPVPIVGNLVTRAENFARTVATGTGLGTAKVLFKSAKAGNKMSQKKLADLLLTDNLGEVLSQQELNPDQLKFATQRFVELSQQLDANYKLPQIWVDEPLLHSFLIFKKFAFQGTKSTIDAMKQDPKRNIPLFLLAAPMFGELTGDMKALVYGAIRGTPMPEDMLDAMAFELRNRGNFAGKLTGLDSEESDTNWLINRLAGDYVQSWGLGLVGDIMQGALGDESAGYAAFVGPFWEQLIGTGRDALQGEGKELLREGTRSIPVAGPGLQRRFMPYGSQEMK